MKNYYLELLQLESGATKSDIKKAYRKLSKKYHPDINKSEDAKEKFIEVAEAYNFLINVGPTPHREKINYDYDPFAEEYRRKREKAREKARQQAEIEAKLKQEMYQRLIAIFNVTCGIILIFNLILVIDYFLPPEQLKLTPDDMQKASARAREEGAPPGYYTMAFDKFQISLPKTAYYVKVNKLNATVYSTPILQTPLYLISKDSGIKIYKQVTSLYAFFGPIILLVFGCGFLYFFIFHAPDPKVYIAMLMVVLFLIQLYIDNQYS